MSVMQIRGDILDKSKALVSEYVKDAEGYRRVPLGAFNEFNAHGDFYPAYQCMPLLTGDSKLGRDLKNGCLYGECQHPPFSEFDVPGVTMQKALESWFARLRIVDNRFVSHHIRAIEPEVIGGGDWRDMKVKVRVWGWVKPHGVYADLVKSSFETPSMNTYFSVRSLCEIKKGEMAPGGTGRMMNMYELYTYDLVTQGGIASACKWRARAGLEAQEPGVLEVKEQYLMNILHKLKKDPLFGPGLEHQSAINDLNRLLGHYREVNQQRRPQKLILPNSSRLF